MRGFLFVLAAAMFPIVPAHAQDAAAGEKVFAQCKACHQVGEKARNAVGPVLNGLFGRKAGTVEGFNYSAANKNSGIVWDEHSLDGWLADPQAMIRGTTMTFRGVADDATRKNLIGFLRWALSPGGAEQVVKAGLIPKDMAAGQIPDDLSSLGPNQRVTEIRHCRDA